MLLKIAGRKIQFDGHEEAYALLHTLWREEFQRPFPEIAYTRRGKPCFVNEDVYFSVTHTKEHVFCTISDRPVGIDAEETDRQVSPDLAEKVLSAGEYRQYLAAEDKNRAFLTFWVLKEAAAKCTGEGLRGYPNKTDFMLTDNRVREVDGCLVAVIREGEKDAF